MRFRFYSKFNLHSILDGKNGIELDEKGYKTLFYHHVIYFICKQDIDSILKLIDRQMKKIKVLHLAMLMGAFFFFSGNLFAQYKDKASAMKNPTKVDNFSEGRTLTDSDLGFLNSLSGKKSRGAATADVTIGGSTYKVGQTLTKEDAANISSAIASSKNAKKVKNKDKSRGDCNLWCYYLLQDSYGNWYYYYYCCG